MDAIFKALNDPARRTLLDSLRQKDGQTLSQLAGQLEMTRFGVMKHLGLLEDAGLITTKKVGRFKHHYLNAVPLQEVIDRWIEPLLAKPVARGLIDLKATLESDPSMYDTDKKPDFVHQTMIRCSQDALWDALTRADQMAAYHFMCNTVEGDVAEGQRTEIKRRDGSVMLAHRTTRLDPKSRIEMTFEPNWEQSTEVSEIAFLIEAEGPFCKLTCEHYSLPVGQEGIADGWMRHIASLKSWLETGEPIKVDP